LNRTGIVIHETKGRGRSPPLLPLKITDIYSVHDLFPFCSSFTFCSLFVLLAAWQGRRAAVGRPFGYLIIGFPVPVSGYRKRFPVMVSGFRFKPLSPKKKHSIRCIAVLIAILPEGFSLFQPLKRPFVTIPCGAVIKNVLTVKNQKAIQF
jgi:hypothetical protein